MHQPQRPLKTGMGYTKKKSFYKKKKSTVDIVDIYLDDYANLVHPGGIPRKQHLRWLPEHEDELLWNEITEPNFDETLADVIRKQEKTKRKRKKRTGTNVYPFDVWFVLSRYIRPEDVGRFAQICRGANEVVSCAPFWFNLYKTYYKKNRNMPEQLLPDGMTKLRDGLRSRVIRSLYYTYSPFVSRYRNVDRPDALRPDKFAYKRYLALGRKLSSSIKCSFAWYEGVPQNCRTYNFILVERGMFSSRPVNDISANETEGCSLLEIVVHPKTIHSYWPYYNNVQHILPDVPEGFSDVCGLRLICIHWHCRNDTHYTFKMIFSRDVHSSRRNMETTELNFANVTKIRIHNWWSPHYPHYNGLI